MDKDKVTTCPFCFNEIYSDVKTCPFCGQNIEPYKDDLNPILDKIQTATNIDMKGTKARVAMGVIVIAMIATAGMLLFDFIDNQPGEPKQEGIIIDIPTNGYVELTGDFLDGTLNANPLYNPDLSLKIELNKSLEKRYEKIVWIIKTDWYNSYNPSSPFYIKVTKERQEGESFSSVVWSLIDIGGFKVTAECYTDTGKCDVYEGQCWYFGDYYDVYSWEYRGVYNIMEFTLSRGESEKYLKVDMEKRMDLQSKSSFVDYINGEGAVKELSEKLRSVFNKNYQPNEVRFADFVLAFIQASFPNVYDITNYGVSDYWAYPSEIILKRCGDDEDRAILFSSLMAASGYGGGILSMPGTNVALVRLTANPGDLEYEFTYVKVTDLNYLVADVDSEKRIGLIRDCYKIGPDGITFYYNGEDVTDRTNIETF